MARRPTLTAAGPPWGTPLPDWYRINGRHDLPWRHTRDPWAVLVSEVMLQQTSVARVLPRWERFMARWPTAARCAAATLSELLREWQGLGYPRRARALHLCAASVAADGWPRDEAGLTGLPGVGRYTARALLALAFSDADALPPRDVNLGRVAARAVLGREPHEVRATDLEAALLAGRPAAMTARDHTLALFDLGATICTARAPRCPACPLSDCASRTRLASAAPAPAPRRQAPWAGSMRRLRGAVLAVMLAPDAPVELEALAARVATVPAASRPGAVAEALAGLRSDGLLPAP